MPASTETGAAVRKIQEDGRESLSDPNIVRQYGNSADKSVVIDHLTFSDDDRKACSVGDDEVVVFPARHDAIGWRGKRRMAQVRHKYGEARQVLFTEGREKGKDPYEHSENMAVAVPRARFEEIEAEKQKRGSDYLAQFHPVDDDGNVYEREVDVFDKTQENYRARARQNGRMFRQMKLGEGGATADMTFEEGLAYYERKGVNIEALENRARRGGEHSPENESRFREILRGNTAKKTIVSGFGKSVNPNSALGQVQQRNARTQGK